MIRCSLRQDEARRVASDADLLAVSSISNLNLFPMNVVLAFAEKLAAHASICPPIAWIA
jgi:hypothetical protein